MTTPNGATGQAFRGGDINGDYQLDYGVISATGKQWFCGLP
ncbi:MAG: hypothetical protein RLZZ385_1618 [Pseudomonadota bacterium]